MQVIILIATIIAGIYFLMFNPDSPIAQFLMALVPLGWVALFSLRFMAERKKKKIEKNGYNNPSAGQERKKEFHDPSDLLSKRD